jgi:hypothetical protein
MSNARKIADLLDSSGGKDILTKRQVAREAIINK